MQTHRLAIAGGTLAVAACITLLVSMQQPPVTHVSTSWPFPDRIAGIPAPEDLVLVREGTPYVVPPEKLFVVTGLSRDNPTTWGTLSAGGPSGNTRLTVQFDTVAVLSLGFAERTEAVPPGLVALSGVVVSVAEQSLNGLTWAPSTIRGTVHGYLFDRVARIVSVKGIPSPAQMMRIEEGTSFTVPAGKRFVATGLGLTEYPLVDYLECTAWSGGESCPPECGTFCCTALESVWTLTNSRLAIQFDGQTIAEVVRYPTLSPSDRLDGVFCEVAPSLVEVSVVERTLLYSHTPDACGNVTGYPYLGNTASKAVILGYLSDD